jgi:hypothetical protein
MPARWSADSNLPFVTPSPNHDLIYSLPQRPSAPVAAWAAASRYTVDQVAISALPSKVDLDDLLWRDGHVILFTPDAEAERAW